MPLKSRGSKLILSSGLLAHHLSNVVFELVIIEAGDMGITALCPQGGCLIVGGHASAGPKYAPHCLSGQVRTAQPVVDKLRSSVAGGFSGQRNGVRDIWARSPLRYTRFSSGENALNRFVARPSFKGLISVDGDAQYPRGYPQRLWIVASDARKVRLRTVQQRGGSSRHVVAEPLSLRTL